MRKRFLSPSLLAFVVVSGALWSVSASADWHHGRLTSRGFAYDQDTVVFTIQGLSKSNCTCYSPWPTNICLKRSARESFKEEFAWLLKVKALDQAIYVNIDETTCAVQAMYESEL